MDLLSERQAARYLGLSLDDWRRRLPRMLAGKTPDMDLAGIPRTQRLLERALRAKGLRNP